VFRCLREDIAANQHLIQPSSATPRAASTQSLKGMFTVGLLKGSKYVLSKVAKRLQPFGALFVRAV
jgi:hypothetical protein